MPFPKTYTGTLTTDASGDGTLTLPASATDGNCHGVLAEVRHVDGGVSNYDDGFDYTVTGSDSSKSFLAETITTTASFQRQPNSVTHDPADGAESTSPGLPVVDNEKIVITVASGGNTKTGTWEVVII